MSKHCVVERPLKAIRGDDFDALIEAAIQLAAEVFAPCAAELDANEPHFDGDRVILPDVLREALTAYIEGGYLAAPFPEADGGLGLPYVVAQAIGAAFYAANPGASAYPLLTAAAANLLRTFGSAEQKARYLAPMLEGRFFGTMVLSEPEAGSSLADLRTRAQPQSDGTYHIVGDKMWISAGEHDLSENIVHLVLARIVGAPAGVKGISLFVVPKRRVQDDGTLGDLNGITLTGLNHKMGYRGTINTALSFGATEPAVGTLVGEPHRGLQYMFHMMNEARTGVGLGATMTGYAGYRVSLGYARDRLQGRHPDQRDPSQPPVPIVEHADVRRMLLMQKVYVEGGLALGMYCARLIDELATAENPEERERLDDLLQILTPIAKAWPSEHGPRANDLAIQVLGGAGYTRDWPVERYYRDNRLNPIHEGTNGIQGLDLLGRKVTMHQGRAFSTADRRDSGIDRPTPRPRRTGRAVRGPDLRACGGHRNHLEAWRSRTRGADSPVPGQRQRVPSPAWAHRGGVDVVGASLRGPSRPRNRHRTGRALLRGQAPRRALLHPLRAAPHRARGTSAAGP